MRRDDRGSGTVLVLTGAAALVAVGVVLTALASAGVARHRAASAADLAALAAADRALLGERAACAAAGRVARAVSAELVRCRLDGDISYVEAELRPPGALGRIGAVRARARAGPQSAARGAEGTALTCRDLWCGRSPSGRRPA